MESILEFFFFFQAEDGIRDYKVTGVQTCALPISVLAAGAAEGGGPQRSARPPRGAHGHRRHRGADPRLHARSEEHTSELQSPCNLVCRLLLEKKKKK